MTPQLPRFFALAAVALVALFGAQAFAYVDVRDDSETSNAAPDEAPPPDDAAPTAEDTGTVVEPAESEEATPSPTPEQTASPTPATSPPADDDDRVASTDDATGGGLPMTGSALLPWTGLGALLVGTGLTALVSATSHRAAPRRFWLELDDL